MAAPIGHLPSPVINPTTTVSGTFFHCLLFQSVSSSVSYYMGAPPYNVADWLCSDATYFTLYYKTQIRQIDLPEVGGIRPEVGGKKPHVESFLVERH